ncbi:MAG: hypothetical protein NVS3B25_31540 [Hymenobacter sp.]
MTGNVLALSQNATVANGTAVSSTFAATTTGTAALGASTITVSVASGIAIGSALSGTGLAAGTTASSVNGTTIGLSTPTTAAVAAATAITVSASGTSTTFNLIGCYDTMSLDLNSQELEVTCRASNDFKEFLTGRHDWSIPIAGTLRHADGADATLNITAENLMDYQLAHTVLSVQFQVGNATPGSAKAIYSGNVVLTKTQISGSIKDPGKFSTTLRGTGALAKTIA